MKKNLLRISALVCVLLLTFSLCGCGLTDQLGKVLQELPFLEKFEFGTTDQPEQQSAVQYVLTGPTDFYEEPSFDAPIVATYYEGYTVVYSSVVSVNGVQWAGANEGWFVLSGSQPDTLLYTDANMDGILTGAVYAYTEPSAASDVSTKLSAGQQVHISKLAMTGGETWGLCDYGWVLIDDTFLDLAELSSPVAYGVVRDDDACFYQAPNIYSGVVGSPACGSRYGLLAVVEIDGLTWACTEAGWMPTESIYEEGTTGFRPCSAVVIDPTPLNVRIAPGTDKDILTTLTYGDRVQILERINYNGSDWGFTGTGWIFMDLTDID